MYSSEDRIRTVELFIMLGKRTGATIRAGFGLGDTHHERLLTSNINGMWPRPDRKRQAMAS